jgi:hypothetical protein
LSIYQINPQESNIEAVIRIFKYLAHTAELKLGINCNQNSANQQSYLIIKGYCDADWAGGRKDRESDHHQGNIQSCIALGNASENPPKMKHIKLRYHFIREAIRKEKSSCNTVQVKK